MGFGYLLVGYFFANIMALFSPLAFAKLVGYPLMLLGLWRLSSYHFRFRVCFWAGFFALPFSVFYTYTALLELGVPGRALSEGVCVGVQWCYFAFCIFFEVLLLFAIGGLSGELSHAKTQTAAFRNLIFVGLYALLYLVVSFLSEAAVLAATYLYLPVLLLRMIFLFLDFWLIFLCYRHICPEIEEGMELEDVTDTKGEKKDEK